MKQTVGSKGRPVMDMNASKQKVSVEEFRLTHEFIHFGPCIPSWISLRNDRHLVSDVGLFEVSVAVFTPFCAVTNIEVTPFRK